MELLAVCVLMAAAAAPGAMAAVDLFCDCHQQKFQDWTLAVHCSRNQNGTSKLSCQKSQVAEIPRGYYYIPSYALIKLYGLFLTWAQATQFCENEGAHLAVPRDQIAYIGVKQIFRTEKTEKRVSYARLGLTDRASEGIFVGLDGVPVSHLPWKPNEPDNYGNAEHCVDVNEDGLISDVRCETPSPFFCERNLPVSVPTSYVWLKNAGRFYKVHSEKRGHAEAAGVCRSENAVLAVADTWRRLEVLLSLLELNDELYHTGFTDEAVEGDFVTDTGRHLKDMEFQLWNTGEPNNRDGNGKPQNCLALSSRGYYKDESCDQPLRFICEIAP